MQIGISIVPTLYACLSIKLNNVYKMGALQMGHSKHYLTIIIIRGNR